MKTLYEQLTDSVTGLDIPCAYSHFDREQELPYLVYMGEGQEVFLADDGYYKRRNLYRLEFYFSEKDEHQEWKIEKWLLDHNFLYEKSEDVFIEDEGVFVIYYTI